MLSLFRISFCLLMTVALVPTAQAGDIELTDFWVRATPPQSKATALYGKIHNHSAQDYHLLKAQCGDAAKKVELHLSKKVDGVAKMIHQEKIHIAANSSFQLKPRSYHVMLMGLKRDIPAGGTLTCHLSFDNDLSLEVTAPVKKPH